MPGCVCFSVKYFVTKTVSMLFVITSDLGSCLMLLADWAVADADAVKRKMNSAVFNKVIVIAFMVTVLNTVQSNVCCNAFRAKFRRMECWLRSTGEKHN